MKITIELSGNKEFERILLDFLREIEKRKYDWDSQMTVSEE